MTCTCGDVMSVGAKNRTEAVSKLKGMMTQAAIAKHMTEKHPGDAVPAVAQIHSMIEKNVVTA